MTHVLDAVQPLQTRPQRGRRPRRRTEKASVRTGKTENVLVKPAGDCCHTVSTWPSPEHGLQRIASSKTKLQVKQLHRSDEPSKSRRGASLRLELNRCPGSVTDAGPTAAARTPLVAGLQQCDLPASGGTRRPRKFMNRSPITRQPDRIPSRRRRAGRGRTGRAVRLRRLDAV